MCGVNVPSTVRRLKHTLGNIVYPPFNMWISTLFFFSSVSPPSSSFFRIFVWSVVLSVKWLQTPKTQTWNATGCCPNDICDLEFLWVLSLKSERGGGSGKFYLFVRELFAFCRFSAVVYRRIFSTISRFLGALYLMQIETTVGALKKYYEKKFLRTSCKDREAFSIFFFHFTLFVFRQI